MELQSLGAFYLLWVEREGWCIESIDSGLINFDLNVSHREYYPSSGDRSKVPERRSEWHEVMVDGRCLSIDLDHNSHSLFLASVSCEERLLV